MSFSIFDITSDWAERAGLAFSKHAETSSTNDLAKSRAFSEEDALSLYVTDHQLKGRGRNDRTWADLGQGNYLLSSWSFLLLKAPQPVIAPNLGLALYKAVTATWLGFPWSLKAPNDLYLGDKKVAGLLVESVQEGARQRLIVGLGMNVFAHPGVDRSGSLTDMIPPEEISPEIWRQFLDRLLLEMTSTLLLAEDYIHPSQQRGLLESLNRFPETKDAYLRVRSDGGLEMTDGRQISWFEL